MNEGSFMAKDIQKKKTPRELLLLLPGQGLKMMIACGSLHFTLSNPMLIHSLDDSISLRKVLETISTMSI